jgi:alpha-L-rhamnosidase
MRRWTMSLLAGSMALAGAAWAGDAQHLQVEHVGTPVGVTTSAPRFSWYLPGSVATRGVAFTQTVEVSQDPGFSSLAWASPASSANVVAYAGPALAANERYYWRVHVTNADGQPSADSSSFFGTGPITEADWQGAQWIKAPGADTPASPEFRTTFTTASGKTVAWATLAVAGLGLNDIYIDDQKLDSEMNASNSDYNKTLFYIVHDVTQQLTAGSHGIGIVLGNGWYDTPEADIYTD